MTRTVLCFGDSNTHGSIPLKALGDRARHDRSTRWPGVLAAALGDGWHVIEEGHGGRTTVHEDPVEGAHRSGLRVFLSLLESHRPLDLVIIMLGTNDLKPRFSASSFDIAAGLERLVRVAQASECGQDGGAPRVLVVSPVPIREIGPLADMFAGGAAKSQALAAQVQAMCARTGADFADAGVWAEVDPDEGIHLGAQAHRSLGAGLAARVKELI